MITLYTFGPFFGLPDASPFVMSRVVAGDEDMRPRGDQAAGAFHT